MFEAVILVPVQSAYTISYIDVMSKGHTPPSMAARSRLRLSRQRRVREDRLRRGSAEAHVWKAHRAIAREVLSGRVNVSGCGRVDRLKGE